METLQYIDQEIFRLLNGWHSPFFDQIMAVITGRKTWIPFYFLIVFLLFRSLGWKKGGLVVLMLIAAVGLADYVTSGLMKPGFGRLRPCHNLTMTSWVHMPTGCGGKFGFASSHAANTFALATGLSLVFSQKRWVFLTMFSWAIIVSYSRIYVGVHYPGDVLVGAVIGIFISLLLYNLLKISTERKS